MKSLQRSISLCLILFGCIVLLHGMTQTSSASEPLISTGNSIHSAFPSILTDWNTAYSGSNSSSAGCQLCHASSSGGDGWNAYGWSIRQEINNGLTPANAILAVAALDADGDGTSNIVEISGDAQPGWTNGANNTIYFKDGTTSEDETPPQVDTIDLEAVGTIGCGDIVINGDQVTIPVYANTTDPLDTVRMQMVYGSDLSAPTFDGTVGVFPNSTPPVDTGSIFLVTTSSTTPLSTSPYYVGDVTFTWSGAATSVTFSPGNSASTPTTGSLYFLVGEASALEPLVCEIPAAPVLSVVKVTDGDPAPAGTEFDVQVDGMTVLTQTGTYTQSIMTATTGTVIGEPTMPTDLAGGTWLLSGSTCSGVTAINNNQDGTYTVDLSPNMDATCTFTNTYTAPPMGTLVIEKITEPVTSTQVFTFTDPSGSGTFTLTGGSSATFELPAGTYSVTEEAVSGWTLDRASCSRGFDPTVEVEVIENRTIQCRYTNIEDVEPVPTTLSIVKVVDGDPMPAGTMFDLQIDGTTVLTAAGTYTEAITAVATDVVIGEPAVPTDPNGGSWSLSGSTCSGVTAINNNNDGTYTVDLSPNFDAMCTFTNTYTAPPPPSILTVIKVVDGDTAPANTVFDVQIDGTVVLTAAGTYTEAIPTGGSTGVVIGEPTLPGTGWSMAASCSGVAAIVNNGDGTFTVDLSDQFDAMCTFTNTYTEQPAGGDDGILSVTKVVAGDPMPVGTVFDIQIDGTTVLTSAGTYTEAIPAGGATGTVIGEPNVPTDPDGGTWIVASSCSGLTAVDDNQDGTYTVGLSPAFDATCTFTNTYTAPVDPPASDSVLTVIKVVQGDDIPANTVFDIQIDGTTVLTAAGTYTEAIPVGGTTGVTIGEPNLPVDPNGGTWAAAVACQQVGNPVQNDNNTVTVDLVDGFDATCTITNRYTPPTDPPSNDSDAVLTVVKVVDGDPMPAGTMFDVQISGTTVLTAAGTYTEAIPVGGTTGVVIGEPTLPGAGWAMSASCSGVAAIVNNGDGTFTVDLSDFFDAMCTFTNTYTEQPAGGDDGILSVTKVVAGDPMPVGTVFDIQIDGTTVLTSAGTYTEAIPAGGATGTVIGEPNVPTDPDGGTWIVASSCSGLTAVDDNQDGTYTVGLSPAFDATCTFTNTYTAPVDPPMNESVLTIVKVVDGEAPADTVFDILVDGTTVLTSAGTYTRAITADEVDVVIGEPTVPTDPDGGTWSLSSSSCSGVTAINNNDDGTYTVNLSPAFDATCTFTNTYTAPTETPTPTPTPIATPGPSTVIFPILIDKVVSDATPVDGDTIQYTIVVTDTNNLPTFEHLITDVIPAGLTPISAVASNGLFTITGQTVTWNPTIDLTAMLTITVSVDAGASARGTITNTAESNTGSDDDATIDPEALPTELPGIAIDKASTVDGNMIDYTITVTNTGDAMGTYIITDTFPTGYMATCEGQVVQEFNVTEQIPAGETRTYSCSIEYNPEISVMKTVDPQIINSGDTVTYTIVLENMGDVPLFNVTTNDPMLPICSATNIGDTHFGGGVFGLLPGGVVTCTAAIPVTATVTNTVMVDADLTIFNSAVGLLVETGALVADTVDNTLETDDEDSAVVSTDFVIEKTVSDATPVDGDIIEYTITVSDVVVMDHTILDVIPQGLTPISAVASSGLFTITGQTVTWTVTTDPMATLTIMVMVDIGASARGTITNTAEAENDMTDDVTIEPEPLPSALPNIAIDKSSAVNGNMIDYTITVTNTGEEIGTYVITDTFPTGYMAMCEGEMVQEFNVTEQIPAGETRTYSCSIEYNPEISVMKTVDPTVIQSGDTVTYSIVLENVGDVPLFNITANDPMLPACSGTNIGDTNFGGGVFGLLPGGVVTCTASMAQTASVVNTVMVDADLTIFNSAQGYLVETGALVADTVDNTMETDDEDSAVVTVVETTDPDSTATISIRKQVVEGSGTMPTDQAFTFNVSTLIDPSGQITLMGGEQVTFTVPATATYVITEEFVSFNWTQTEAICSGIETESADSFNVVPDEVVTCVFTNQYDDPPLATPTPTPVTPTATPVTPTATPVTPTATPITPTPLPTDMPTPVPAAVYGTLWNDPDGIPNNGDESGIPNVTVNLLDDAGNVVATTTTNGNGFYLFQGLDLGEYTIQVDDTTVPEGKGDVDTDPIPVSLTEDDPFVEGADVTYPAALGSISDVVFHDIDGDGVQDADEPILTGVSVILTRPDGSTTTVTTDLNGVYTFDNLPQGEYDVTIDPSTLPGAKKQADNTGDPDGDGNSTTTVSVDGNDVTNIPFGYQAPEIFGSIGNLIYSIGGTDGNIPLPDVTVQLIENGVVISTTVTADDGTYSFDNVPLGDYTITVVESTLPDEKQGKPVAYSFDNGSDSSADVSLSAAVPNNPNLNFGYGSPTAVTLSTLTTTSTISLSLAFALILLIAIAVVSRPRVEKQRA